MLNTHLGIAFVNHWLEVVNEHSLHAPFIFEIYQEVIKKDKTNDNHSAIEKIRQELLRNKSEINIQDLGAGSKVSKATKRTISSVAKSALSSPRHLRLLSRLAESNSSKNIIELGTSLGISACYLAKASVGSHVYTFEGCTDTARVAQKTFESLSADNITLEKGNIEVHLPRILQSLGQVDFAYLDANHTFEATTSYFNILCERITCDSIIVIDDIHWSRGMNRAWNEIVKSKRVTLSIDLFDIGILFFKKLGQKQHYVLRF